MSSKKKDNKKNHLKNKERERTEKKTQKENRILKNKDSFQKEAMHPKARKKQEEKKIAREHLKELFQLADEQFSTDQARAQRYIQLARTIQMKYKIRMPTELKRKYCKHCHHYIRSGTNGRIRIREKTLIIYCEHCKKYTRIPFKKNNTVKSTTKKKQETKTTIKKQNISKQKEV